MQPLLLQKSNSYSPFFVFDFCVGVKIITPLSVSMEGSPYGLLPCFKIFHSAVINKKNTRIFIKSERYFVLFEANLEILD